jgi:phosphoglycerate dehydrogenase-like enzyme
MNRINPPRIHARTLLAIGALVLSAQAFALSAADPKATALIEELGLQQSAVASRDLPGWKAPGRIVVAYASPEQVRQLQALVPQAEVLAAAQGEALAEQLASAQVVIGPCNAATLEAAKSLHWMQALSVGVERCVGVPGLAERNIVLTNMQRTSGPPIAEHSIAMMLALARGFPQYARHQSEARWSDEAADRDEMREIGGRTMLVVGLGGIGTEVARRAHALGMRVIATRNSSREGPKFVAKVGLSDELHALAAEADVVVNATPLTPETTAIFDAKFFAAMKRGGYFINVGRGKSVVTDDLVAALKSGQVGGAGLDVTEPEPLPDGHPLWSLRNVIITPHVSANSDVQDQRSWILIAENLRRYAAGEPLLNVVDIERGY